MHLCVLWRKPYMPRKWHLHTSRYGYILPVHYTLQKALHVTKEFFSDFYDCFQSHWMEQITEDLTAQTRHVLRWNENWKYMDRTIWIVLIGMQTKSYWSHEHCEPDILQYLDLWRCVNGRKWMIELGMHFGRM